MSESERRQAANAALRQKIDQIQAGNQALKTAIDEMADRLINSARQSGAWSMPDTQHAVKRVEKLFQSQTAAWVGTQADITGEVAREPLRAGNVPLISPDEMAALMKMQS